MCSPRKKLSIAVVFLKTQNWSAALFDPGTPAPRTDMLTT